MHSTAFGVNNLLTHLAKTTVACDGDLVCSLRAKHCSHSLAVQHLARRGASGCCIFQVQCQEASPQPAPESFDWVQVWRARWDVPECHACGFVRVLDCWAVKELFVVAQDHPGRRCFPLALLTAARSFPLLTIVAHSPLHNFFRGWKTTGAKPRAPTPPHKGMHRSMGTCLW